MVLETLRSLQAYESPDRGFRERFLVLEIGGGRTVGVLSTPLSAPTMMGWVVCSSFGMEQVHLMAFDVSLARTLAAAGFAALRFHAQGYGDSEFDLPSRGSHVRDAVDAVGVLLELVHPNAIGLIGARYGATIAAQAADRRGADALVLVEPVTRGKSYLESLQLQDHAEHLVSHGRSKSSERLERGPVDSGALREIGGFAVPIEVIEEISAVDLVRDLATFAGLTAVLQVSRSSGLKRDTRTLIERLEELGGHTFADELVHPDALKLVLPPRVSASEARNVNVQEELLEMVVSRTAGWCSNLASGLA